MSNVLYKVKFTYKFSPCSAMFQTWFCGKGGVFLASFHKASDFAIYKFYVTPQTAAMNSVLTYFIWLSFVTPVFISFKSEKWLQSLFLQSSLIERSFEIKFIFIFICLLMSALPELLNFNTFEFTHFIWFHNKIKKSEITFLFNTSFAINEIECSEID